MAIQQPADWSEFSGLNRAYLLDLYEAYRTQPESVDPELRTFFDRSGPPPENGAAVGAAQYPSETPLPRGVTAGTALQVAGAVALATAIRTHGHRAAQLDPLGSPPPGDASLRPETHLIREEDLASLPASIIGGPVAERAGNALAAIRYLRKIYQRSTGYEFEHVSDADERAWLRDAVESGRFRPPLDPIDERKLLEQLTEVGAFERFLHSAFPGQTRFSLEGLGMMVPMLDELVGAAAEAGTRCVMLGMAHRGRLNVLAHVLNKPYEQVIAEFMGRYTRSRSAPGGAVDDGWTGDVKYHLGARRAYRGGREVEMSVMLIPNPSHLEWVNPVVLGMDRAADERRDSPGSARQDELASMSVLIHGDASFPGQGIVAETLNLSRLPGYRVGGAIHLIANNQLGFTTNPSSGRSTLYASDLAKGFEIPVIHVNADDVEACIAAARLAHEYRHIFRKDVLIDLIGYRRWGHNEGDEPSYTQPKLYASIAKQPTVRERWAGDMVRRGLVTREETEEMLRSAIAHLQQIKTELQAQAPPEESANGRITAGLEAGGARGGLGRAGAAERMETEVPLERLARLNEELYRIPEGFHLHSKLERPFARRRAVFAPEEGEEAPAIEWAHAEALAFASILEDGTPIRFSGQDVARGTFSHRHAVLFDSGTGTAYTPLQSLSTARAAFEIWNSPLSEQATLAFEFGYSIQAPEALTLWEAQYGDFVNVPQAVIDQFIVSARSKWEQYSGLVMLLPHGYEGQGPEHSSARPERFLQMAAEDNLRIANCTTAAQYFHILRRQMCLLSRDPRPLILLTPKSLLRNPLAASRPEELAEGRFRPVLEDVRAMRHREKVRRLLFCSGKVYYDMVAARQTVDPEIADAIAVARVEELYPFPAEDVASRVGAYPSLEEVVWLQEEPRNMGAWTFVAPRLRDIIAGRYPLRYIGRTRRASPAEGSHQWHVREQARLVAAALQFERAPEDEPLMPEVQHAR
ncbi:MAG: 2-oxoglutarate dehydrogenase E1 component [Armatimonadota bacterium]